MEGTAVSLAQQVKERGMIEQILFPVDFSPFCEGMAGYVKRAAAMFNSRTTLLHVCSLESQNGFELYVRGCDQEGIAKDHLDIAGRKLDSFLEADFPPGSCPRLVRSGDPATEIAEAARTGEFDLIIMPTHGGQFRRMLLSSTTAKVLNDSDCPVLTTEHASGKEPRPLEHREWACGVSLDEQSKGDERLLRFASKAATQIGARLSLIHVIPEMSGQQAVHRVEALRRIDELKKAVGCDAVVQIVTGPVKEALLDAARELVADALIIGRPRSGDAGRLGDLTHGLVRDSLIPVVSV